MNTIWERIFKSVIIGSSLVIILRVASLGFVSVMMRDQRLGHLLITFGRGQSEGPPTGVWPISQVTVTRPPCEPAFSLLFDSNSS